MVISERQYQKAFEASIIAEAFLATAELIDKDIHNGFQRVSFFVYPHTVNAAAACELALKALLILQDGKCENIHPLDELYKEIGNTLKETIAERYKHAKYDMPLEECLEKYKNAIVDWRYAFDDKYYGVPLIAAWKDLIGLDHILCDIVEEQLQASPFYKEDNNE